MPSDQAGQLRRARAADMAAFVVRFGWTPTDYYALTLAEREAIVAETARQARAARRR